MLVELSFMVADHLTTLSLSLEPIDEVNLKNALVHNLGKVTSR